MFAVFHGGEVLYFGSDFNAAIHAFRSKVGATMTNLGGVEKHSASSSEPTVEEGFYVTCQHCKCEHALQEPLPTVLVCSKCDQFIIVKNRLFERKTCSSCRKIKASLPLGETIECLVCGQMIRSTEPRWFTEELVKSGAEFLDSVQQKREKVVESLQEEGERIIEEIRSLGVKGAKIIQDGIANLMNKLDK